MPMRALDQLIRDDAERLALRSNGFVCSEERSYCQVYKLRFRVQGRQRVRYLGTVPAVAEAVRLELMKWQRRRRAAQRLRQAVQYARQVLRESRQRLEPLVLAAGFKLHGREIRRPRRKV